LSTELDSSQRRRRVCAAMVVAIKRPRARRRKAVVEPTAEPTEKVETKTEMTPREKLKLPRKN